LQGSILGTVLFLITISAFRLYRHCDKANDFLEPAVGAKPPRDQTHQPFAVISRPRRRFSVSAWPRGFRLSLEKVRLASASSTRPSASYLRQLTCKWNVGPITRNAVNLDPVWRQVGPIRVRLCWRKYLKFVARPSRSFYQLGVLLIIGDSSL
jgi:hypothetical protein